jgi:hypothetical protein
VQSSCLLALLGYPAMLRRRRSPLLLRHHLLTLPLMMQVLGWMVSVMLLLPFAVTTTPAAMATLFWTAGLKYVSHIFTPVFVQVKCNHIFV